MQICGVKLKIIFYWFPTDPFFINCMYLKIGVDPRVLSGSNPQNQPKMKENGWVNQW